MNSSTTTRDGIDLRTPRPPVPQSQRASKTVAPGARTSHASRSRLLLRVFEVLAVAGIALAISAPSADARTLVSGTNVVGWCQNHWGSDYFVSAVATNPHDVYSWRCTVFGVFKESVNMDDACHRQQGWNTYAFFQDRWNASSWRCYR